MKMWAETADLNDLDGTKTIHLVPEVHGPTGPYTRCVEVTLVDAEPELSYDDLLDYVASIDSEDEVVTKAKDKKDKQN